MPSIDNMPLTVKFAVVMVFTPLTPAITSLNVVDPVTVCADPPKFTVLELAVKVPLLDQLPFTVNVFDPVMPRLAPELIVILLHSAVDPITG